MAMTTPVSPTTATRFPALDGLRALAATAVVGTHVAFASGWGPGDLGGRIAARLDVGVALFFVLSGFLLSRPFLAAAVQGRPAPGAVAYLWRRALRVLPAYWLLVVAALLLLPGNAGTGTRDWVGMLSLTQIYRIGVVSEGLTHTWSLYTEVAFYLVLPLLAAVLVRAGVRRGAWRPGRVYAVLAVLAVGGWGWLVAACTVWQESTRAGGQVGLWLPAYAGWFGAGIALAVLSVSPVASRGVRRAHALGDHPWTCWGTAGAVLWVAATPLAGPFTLDAPTAAGAVTKNALYLVVATLVVWPLVFGDQSRGVVRQHLAGPAGQTLGRLSYGLFLFHMPVLVGGYELLGAEPLTGSFGVVFPLVWLAGTGCAWLSWRLVESPAQRFRGLVRDRSRTAPVRAGETASASAATATSAQA